MRIRTTLLPVVCSASLLGCGDVTGRPVVSPELVDNMTPSFCVGPGVRLAIDGIRYPVSDYRVTHLSRGGPVGDASVGQLVVGVEFDVDPPAGGWVRFVSLEWVQPLDRDGTPKKNARAAVQLRSSDGAGSECAVLGAASGDVLRLTMVGRGGAPMNGPDGGVVGNATDGGYGTDGGDPTDGSYELLFCLFLERGAAYSATPAALKCESRGYGPPGQIAISVLGVPVP